MPVIRGKIRTKALTTAQRRSLLKDLVKELETSSTVGGPIIFEIPLEQSDRIDVLVIWDAIENLRSEDRTGLIMDAYKGRENKIAQAIAVTRKEAIEHGWLPYDLRPVSERRGEKVNQRELREAMQNEGGFLLDDDRFVLRFPTWAMAEEASYRLMDRIPQVNWCIEQVGP